MTTEKNPVDEAIEEGVRAYGPITSLTIRDKVVAEAAYWQGRAAGIREVAMALYEAAATVENHSPEYANLYRLQADGLKGLHDDALENAFARAQTRADVAEGLRDFGL